MVKAKFEDALHSLRQPLRERLDAIVDHLHAAPWPDREALCFAPGAGVPTLAPRAEWSAFYPHESDQIRYDTYRWSLERLQNTLNKPVSLADALGQIEDAADGLVAMSVDMLAVAIEGLVAKEYRCAVLSRARLVRDWTWPLEIECGGAYLHLLLSLCDTLPPQEQFVASWPADAAVTPVAEWARRWLERNARGANKHTTGSVVDAMKATRRLTPTLFALRRGLPCRYLASPALALLYLLEHEVKQHQKRSFIAIDTSKEHTKLLEAWRDLPKAPGPAYWCERRSHRLIELILPEAALKRNIQLSLDLGPEGLTELMTQLIRDWRGWQGLRHWVTFLSLLTANKRRGWVRWTVDAHLEAQNVSVERRRRLEVRRQAAHAVELFTQMELAVYDEKGKLREKRPLILKGSTFEKLVDSQWEIEGLELRINPLIYRGVRDPDTEELGHNWWPSPQELPHISHSKFGPAIALGIILPCRWRMELARTGKDYIDLRGDNLLRAAGLPCPEGNSAKAWRSLHRNLAELQRRGGVERWEWRGEPGFSTLCRLHAPDWALDRIARGVPPQESLTVLAALTGSELMAWRKERKLSQARAALLLGVGHSTVKRAEAAPQKPLTKKLRAALADHRHPEM